MPRKPRALTKEEEIKVTELYNQGLTKKQISLLTPISYESLKHFFDTHNMSNKELGIPKKVRPEIVEKYLEGYTLQQLHDMFYPQYSVDQINYVCRIAGVTRANGKVAHLNHNYFDNINSEEKAYWLGLLFADGSIIQYANKTTPYLSFQLMQEDGYLVRQFAKDVETDLMVRDYINDTGFQRQDGSAHIMSTLRLHSAHMMHTLMSYGMIPRKSLLLEQLPVLDDSLYRHFIRGYFDGNGSITYHRSKKIGNPYRIPHIHIYSTCVFCQKLAQILANQLDIKTPKIIDQKHERVSMVTYGVKYVEKIYHYLYDDMNDEYHYCKRKKVKMEELIGEYRDNCVA